MRSACLLGWVQEQRRGDRGMPTYRTSDPGVVGAFDSWRREVDRRIGDLRAQVSELLGGDVELVSHGPLGVTGVEWDDHADVPTGWRRGELPGTISPDVRDGGGRAIAALFFAVHAGVADSPELAGMEGYVRAGEHWLHPTFERRADELAVTWPTCPVDPRTGPAAELWREAPAR